MPARRANPGAAAASTPKHSNGSMVSTAAPVPVSPSPARTSGNTGPTLANAARKFSASTMTVRPMITACRRINPSILDGIPVTAMPQGR